MSVYKRYNKQRIKRENPHWEQGTWYVEFRLREHYVKQAIPEARTQKQAEQVEIHLRKAIFDGKYNRASGTTRFADFVTKEFLPWSRHNKESWKHDESRAAVLIEFFGNRQLRDITPLLIEKLKRQLSQTKTKRTKEQDGQVVKREMSGSTVNRYLQQLSKIFTLAWDNGLVDQNPVARVRKFKETGKRERYLTLDEETRLLAALTGRLAYHYPVILLDINTGLRKTELLSLRWEHVNLSHQSVFFTIGGKDVEVKPNHLLVERSKNKRPRTVPLNRMAREILSPLRQDAADKEYVFSSARTGVCLKEIKKGFKKACELAGIPFGQNTAGGLTFHDLRHTFATRLRERGWLESDIMVLLGHSSIRMTLNYAHATPRVLADAVESLCEKRGEVIEFQRQVG